jgi:hypothetical protein
MKNNMELQFRIIDLVQPKTSLNYVQRSAFAKPN